MTPYPLSVPKHGGQVRAASILAAARRAGWAVDHVGIYPSTFFPQEEWGLHDVVLDSDQLVTRTLRDMAFADFHVAQTASASVKVISNLRRLLTQLAPDVIHVEQPWGWLVLREALPSGHGCKIIYSSQNIEWRARLALFELPLGLFNPNSAAMVEATRLLEYEFARKADLVMSISDVEAAEIEQESGRSVVYLPAVAELVEVEPSTRSRFAQQARSKGCRFAALIGSNYWPNVEGFFEQFENGLGFLRNTEQIWMAGSIGQAIVRDPRYGDYASINSSRSNVVGYLSNVEKSEFLASAACVVVPVTKGAGAKLKTADAIKSGRAVIATPHSLEGYGPLVKDALGEGVFVGSSPSEFRQLVKEAVRTGLPGCKQHIRERFGIASLSAAWAAHVEQLVNF